MKRRLTYYLFIFFTLLNGIAKSQSLIEIINADQISFNKKINQDRQVLIGNVKTKHKNRFLICDSAYYYSIENKIEAFSNIHIWQGDTLELKGDYLIYHGNNQLAEIHNNVKFRHNNMNLTSDQLKYNFEYDKAFYDHKAHITERKKSLTSIEGVYDASIEKFDFYKEVVIETEKETLRSDTLYYWLKNEYTIFKSNGSLESSEIHAKAQSGWIDQKEGKAFLNNKVEMTDLKNKYVLRSDTCFLFEKLSHSISYGNTLLSIPLINDTLYLTGDTLIQRENIEGNLLIAYPNSNFMSIDMVGSCDSLSYTTQNETLFLNKEPVMWLDEFQLSSNSIRMLLNKDQINKAFLNKNAFITSRVDSNAFNQISGENMTAYFKENQLTNIEVLGNGESIYYVKDEKSTSSVGVNKIICSNMNIIVKNRAIDNINFYEKPDATLHPINKIQAKDLLLKGFTWKNKPDVLSNVESKMNIYKLFHD